MQGPPEERGLQNGSFFLPLPILRGITAQNKHHPSYPHLLLCAPGAEAPAEETLTRIHLSQGTVSQWRCINDSIAGGLGQFLASPVRTAVGPRLFHAKRARALGASGTHP